MKEPLLDDDKIRLASEVARGFEKFPTMGQLLGMVRRGYRAEASILTDARGLSSTFYRLRLVVFRQPFNEYQVGALALKHLRNWTRLMVRLDVEGIACVPYIRCQLESFGGKPFISALPSDAAVARYEKWAAAQEVSATLYREDKGASLRREVSTIPGADDVLLSEIRSGLHHVAYVQRLSGIGNEEAIAWMERGALPGGYLLTVPAVMAEYGRGGLEPFVRERIQKAETLSRSIEGKGVHA